LLNILGYRLRGCGKDAALETADPESAFLTIRFGIPSRRTRANLCRAASPFTCHFAPTPVPLLFSPDDWIHAGTMNSQDKKDVLDSLLDDPALARLYWAMARMDTENQRQLPAICGSIQAAAFRSRLDFTAATSRFEMDE
jgi:hypothetical protein